MNTGLFILMILFGPLAVFITVLISLRRSRKLIDQLVESFQPQWDEANLIAEKIQGEMAGLSASKVELQKKIESIKNNVDVFNNFRSPKSSEFLEDLGNYYRNFKLPLINERFVLDKLFIPDLTAKEAKISLEITTIKLSLSPEHVEKVLEGIFGEKNTKLEYSRKLAPDQLENLLEQTSTKTPGRTLH